MYFLGDNIHHFQVNSEAQMKIEANLKNSEIHGKINMCSIDHEWG